MNLSQNHWPPSLPSIERKNEKRKREVYKIGSIQERFHIILLLLWKANLDFEELDEQLVVGLGGGGMAEHGDRDGPSEVVGDADRVLATGTRTHFVRVGVGHTRVLTRVQVRVSRHRHQLDHRHLLTSPTHPQCIDQAAPNRILADWDHNPIYKLKLCSEHHKQTNILVSRQKIATQTSLSCFWRWFVLLTAYISVTYI